MNTAIKKTLVITLASLSSYAGFSQKETKTDTTTFKIGDSRVIFINSAPDSLEYDYNFNKSDSICTKKDTEDWPKIVFDIGSNGYLSSDREINLPNDQELLELNYGRSRSFGFAFQFKGYESTNKRLFISPGLGITWNGYHFENNININSTKDTTAFRLDTINNNKKYKLRATYLELPLIIGKRFGNLERPVSIQVGVVAGLRLGSIVKQKFEDNGQDRTVTVHDDFNITPFKFDYIVRITFGEIGVFGRYSATHLFKDGKAPELYPFSVGITLGKI